ncbi:GWxTD domain-containing protein [Dyadobacter sp. CY343]|uniref:GWxTD domain-containing protein n=1 Tax=Dyadobacter sp. CY343 TaxID=2907299 RepID=UPI001F318D71|nr:GWxTD domain-containing protein [Dyadobacter sp. CY343]MCE7061090.1 GWxTD domain-containing protein [Dyadobacter sp. CY343]
MRTSLSVLAHILTVAAIAGCASSNKTVKQLPEAQVRSTQQSAPLVSEEPSLVAIQSKYILKDTTQTKVFLYVDAFKGKNPITPADFIKTYNLNYVIYSDYGTRERLGYGNVKLDSSNVSTSGQKIVISYDLKSPNRDYGVLLSEISQTGTLKKVLNDLTIRFKKLDVNQTYGVYTANSTQPLQRHYINSNESFVIKKLNPEEEQLHVFYYNHDFEAAGSPMNIANKGVSKSLEVDSTFTIQANQPLQFAKEGLYNIFSDTTQAEGLGVLVVNERFPKLTQPQLLLGPLLYMSTNTEINEIKKAEDYKKALDKYWLTLMNGNAPLAQQSIRSFYSRVEEANQLFTTYKEGWKTDKGMIYIVLGPPDKVQRSKDREVWSYDQRGNAQNVNFTFNRKNNQFVDDHYELVRYAEYQPIWYPVVEAWRNGSIR